MKAKQNDFQAGFDLTEIGVKNFIKLIKRFDLQWTQRKKSDYAENTGAYVYGFKEGHITLGNDPLTGNYYDPKARHYELGYASYIGIEGTKQFRDKMVRFIKTHATYIKDYSAGRRDFI